MQLKNVYAPVAALLSIAAGTLLATGVGTSTRAAAPESSRRPVEAAQDLAPGGRLASLGMALNRARHQVASTGNPEAPFVAVNPGRRLAARFTRSRVELTAPSRGEKSPWRTSLRTTALGRGARLLPVRPGPVSAKGDRVEYAHRAADSTAVTEWWVNTPAGMEQGWTVYGKDEGGRIRAERDAAAPQPLTLSLAVEGSLHPVVAADGQTVELRDRENNPVLLGAGLKAWDATGRTLPVRMAATADGAAASQHLLLSVDAKDATYPVTIDPTWTQQQRVTQPVGDAAESDYFGRAVAINGDTAVVTAPQDDLLVSEVTRYNAGSAFVFTRSGGVWTLQQKLQAPDSEVNSGDGFGASAAIDGDTVAIGANNDSASVGGSTVFYAGAVYVFVRSGSVWSLQQKLTQPVGDAAAYDDFGSGLALVDDTLVVNSRSDDPVVGGSAISDAGAAYVFTRSGTTWTQQQKLTEPEGDADASDQFGESVSFDGTTVVVGTRMDDLVIGGSPKTNAGAAYVFVQSGGVWTLEQKLTAPDSDASGDDQFGAAVAVNGDTVIAGAPGESPVVGGSVAFGAGAAYVFSRNGGVWTQEQKLTAPAGDAAANDNFGSAVAMAGNFAVINDNADDPTVGGTTFTNAGATYVFALKGGAWTLEQKLTEPAGDIGDNDLFGRSVAISGDTIIAGAEMRDPVIGGDAISDTGAAYFFVGITVGQPPVAEGNKTLPVTEDTVTGLNITAPTDPDPDPLTITVNSVPASGKGVIRKAGGGATVAAHDFLTVAELTGLEFHPVANQTGAAGTFSYTVEDGNGGTADQTVTLNITPVNDTPVGTADTYTYVFGTPLTVTGPGVLSNDTDVDGDTLQATIVTQPAYGTVALNADGGFTYTSQTGYPLNTSFTYRASDPSSAQTAVVTVTLNVSYGVTLTAPDTVVMGKPLTVQWTAPAGQSGKDWIGFYRSDVTNPSGYVSWIYTNGKTSGSYTVTAPAPGTYVFRYHLNDGVLLAATSNVVNVTDAPASEYTLTLSPSSVGPGGSFTVTWNAPVGRPTKDWIGIYSSSTPNSSGYIAWFYTGGTQTGSKTLSAPTTAGTYLARYYQNDGSSLAATSNTLTVTTPSTPTVTAGATSVTTGGTLAVNWTAPAGQPTKDWVALVRADQLQAGPPQVVTGYLKWAYTGGATSGSTIFSLSGVAPGTYYLVYLLNDTYTVGAQSAAITVTP